MTDRIDTSIESETNFWDSKEQPYETPFVCCQDDCGCANRCELNNTCSCQEREDDVCPNCMDSVISGSYKKMIEGTAGKEQIEYVIELKTLLKSFMPPDSETVKVLDTEIKLLQLLRDNQKE